MVLVFIDLLFKKSGCWDVKRLGLAGRGGPVPLGREARTVGFSVFLVVLIYVRGRKGRCVAVFVTD